MKDPTSQPALRIPHLSGARLGNYAVRELLGSGGMAQVYRGYDVALDREVAIKVISTTGRPPDFIARFQREAQVVARLRHPHIVQVYHFGAQDEFVYMVQELLPGPTLAQRIRDAGRRRIPPERVHAIIDQIAAALDFAHRHGIIHRDVKPGNAIYNAQAQLVLTDFGVAYSQGETPPAARGPGILMGTPSYVAPEQAISSAALTPACDIYSLGVVLFELLTGRLPFEADTPMGVMLKHLYDDPPPPGALRADLPKALDQVVLKALSKEIKDRYPSAGALARALREAWPLGHTSVIVTNPGRSAAKRSDTPAKPASAATPTAPAARDLAAQIPQPAVAHKAPAPRSSRPVQRAAQRARPRAHAPQPGAPWGLRISLITINLIAALALLGLSPAAQAEVWRVLLQLRQFLP